MTIGLGKGTSEAFFVNEFAKLDLNDKRLNERAKKIAITLQEKLTSCIRRMFLDRNDARQAYDFFFQP